MKNLVYIVAIDFDVKKHAVVGWEYYCNKIGVDFKVIGDRSNPDMAPHWERYTIMERFPEYDNYLYVDADALIKWDAPNFFELLPEEHLYAVKDLGSLEWVYNGMMGYQDLFPNTKFDWWEYFTTGFLRFNKKHKQLFKQFIKFHNQNQEELNLRQYQTLKKGFDQTPFNYFIRQQGYKFEILPEVYSLGHLHKKDIFQNGMFINIPSYIWQFNGIPKEQLPRLMGQIWEHIKEQYKN